MTDYHDDDGNPVSLDQLCRNEPRWAATQIARLRERVADLEERLTLNDQSALETTLLMMEREQERDEARAELDSWKNNTRNALTVAIDERDALRAEAGRLRERVAALESHLDTDVITIADLERERDEARAELAKSISVELPEDVQEALSDRWASLAGRTTTAGRGRMTTWCPECGPDVLIDEDGCCATCGNGATGPGVDEIARLRARVAELERERDEARSQLAQIRDGLHPEGVTCPDCGTRVDPKADTWPYCERCANE